MAKRPDMEVLPPISNVEDDFRLPKMRWLALAGVYMVGIGVTGLDLFWPLKVLWRWCLHLWSLNEQDWNWTGEVFSVVCGLLLLVIVFAELMRRSEEQAAANTTGNEFGRGAIANFREASPHGDAQLAHRAHIQRALMGHSDPSAPKFED